MDATAREATAAQWSPRRPAPPSRGRHGAGTAGSGTPPRRCSPGPSSWFPWRCLPYSANRRRILRIDGDQYTCRMCYVGTRILVCALRTGEQIANRPSTPCRRATCVGPCCSAQDGRMSHGGRNIERPPVRPASPDRDAPICAGSATPMAAKRAGSRSPAAHRRGACAAVGRCAIAYPGEGSAAECIPTRLGPALRGLMADDQGRRATMPLHVVHLALASWSGRPHAMPPGGGN